METSTINCAHKLYTPWVKLHTHVANVNAKRKNFGNSPFENESAQTPSNLRGCQKKNETGSFCVSFNKLDSIVFTPSSTKNYTFNFSFHPCIHCGQNPRLHSTCSAPDATAPMVGDLQKSAENSNKFSSNKVALTLTGWFCFFWESNGMLRVQKMMSGQEAAGIIANMQLLAQHFTTCSHVRFQNKQGATQLNVWTVTLHFPKRNKQLFCVFRPNHVFLKPGVFIDM